MTEPPAQKQAAKMWAGRFRAAPDPFFDQWQRSIGFDWQLLWEELAASRAHALALQAAGVLTEDECGRIVRTLKSIGSDYSTKLNEVRDNPEAEDIHHFVELRLADAIGDLGLKLHTGRSRNEQIATDLRLYIRFRIDVVAGPNRRLGTAARRAGTIRWVTPLCPPTPTSSAPSPSSSLTGSSPMLKCFSATHRASKTVSRA